MRFDFVAKKLSLISEAELDLLVKELTTRSKSGIRDSIDAIPADKLWCCVAYHGDKPVGWCVLECSSLFYAQVYVKPAYRGKGIGTELLARANQKAESRGRSRLYVCELQRSWKFYDKFNARVKSNLWWCPLKQGGKKRKVT